MLNVFTGFTFNYEVEIILVLENISCTHLYFRGNYFYFLLRLSVELLSNIGAINVGIIETWVWTNGSQKY